MWNKSALCISGCLFAALCQSALAGDDTRFSFVADYRQCNASFSGNASGSSWDDPETPFEFFEGGAIVSADNGIERWSASSSQHSSMSALAMQFNAASLASVLADPSSNTLQSRAQPRFDSYFTVAAPTQYALVGRLSEFGHADSIAQITLTRVVTGNPVIHTLVSTTNSDQTFSWHGTLEPGMYRIFAEGSARCRATPPLLAASANASCSFVFTALAPLDCPSDWNGDGVVDTADFFLFLEQFLSSGADYNGDGVSDSADFFDFIGRFQAGC